MREGRENVRHRVDMRVRCRLRGPGLESRDRLLLLLYLRQGLLHASLGLCHRQLRVVSQQHGGLLYLQVSGFEIFVRTVLLRLRGRLGLVGQQELASLLLSLCS